MCKSLQLDAWTDAGTACTLSQAVGNDHTYGVQVTAAVQQPGPARPDGWQVEINVGLASCTLVCMYVAGLLYGMIGMHENKGYGRKGDGPACRIGCSGRTVHWALAMGGGSGDANGG